MIKYYDILDTDPGGGGGGDKLPPPQPKDYTPLTVGQRADWNGFLDYASKQNGANLSDPKQQATLLASYKKANPNFSVTAAQLPAIQYEAYQLRKGDSFGSLNAKQLGYIRQGMNSNFLNADVSNLGKTYYPQMGAYGTDVENYYNSKFNPVVAKPVVNSPAPAPTTPPVSGPTIPGRLPDAMIAGENTVAPSGGIPRPDYGDPKSRMNFAAAYQKKYGTEEGYGDIPLRVNERPYKGTGTSKEMAIAASKSTGLDPALIYSSSMVEGASGLFPDKNGKVRFGSDPDYPIQGASFGLNNFYSRVPEMVKKGYLPKDFDYKKYTPTDEEVAKTPNVTRDGAVFKTANDAMLAHAARLKLDYDEIDDYAKKQGIKLSPQARDFFALAHFNSGKGESMMDDYKKRGVLANDAFMKGAPDPEHHEIYDHVMIRLKERTGLKKEALFQ